VNKLRTFVVKPGTEVVGSCSERSNSRVKNVYSILCLGSPSPRPRFKVFSYLYNFKRCDGEWRKPRSIWCCV